MKTASANTESSTLSHSGAVKIISGGFVTGGSVTGGSVTGGFVTGGSVTGGSVTGGSVTGGFVTGGFVTGGSVSKGSSSVSFGIVPDDGGADSLSDAEESAGAESVFCRGGIGV